MLESATNAKIPFMIMSQIVDQVRNGILNHLLSDRAQNMGEVMSANNVAREKLAPYRISGNLLSMISH